MEKSLLQLFRVVRPDGDGAFHIRGKKIYILPTRYGLIFGVLLVTLLIASINYANNPAFILTFLLTGLFIQTIFTTWRNLLGLSVHWKQTLPVFAGETAFFEYQLEDPRGRDHYAIQLAFSHNTAVVQDCTGGHKTLFRIPCITQQRGWLEPGKMTLESRFPLGLMRAWCYLETPGRGIVYPKPKAGYLEHAHPSWGKAVEGNKGVGTDDFVGHRGYHPGDSLAHIYWKALAGEKGLLVKQFGGDRINRFWLEFDAIDPSDTETRLSILTSAVQRLSQEGAYYGLRLPHQEIDIGAGERHRQQCLTALALYGLDP